MEAYRGSSIGAVAVGTAVWLLLLLLFRSAMRFVVEACRSRRRSKGRISLPSWSLTAPIARRWDNSCRWSSQTTWAGYHGYATGVTSSCRAPAPGLLGVIQLHQGAELRLRGPYQVPRDQWPSVLDQTVQAESCPLPAARNTVDVHYIRCTCSIVTYRKGHRTAEHVLLDTGQLSQAKLRMFMNAVCPGVLRTFCHKTSLKCLPPMVFGRRLACP